MRPVGPTTPAVLTPEVTPLVSMSASARFRYAMVAGATAVVIGAGFTTVGLHQRAGDQPSPRSADAPLAAAAPPGAATDDLLDDAASAGAAPDPASSTLPPSPAPTSAPASRSSSRPATVKPKPPARRSSAPASRKPASNSARPSTSSAILTAVLADINQARARAGLPAYTLDADLSKASALHNQLMINGCGLAHQCPGEQSIGPRFSAQGVHWTAAGENIGFGSSGASESAIISAANGLTASMLAETPPGDGHRKNLLSSTFKHIGLSVVRDSSGKTWMTQDFVN
jgi:uncharacterized protein YkwD